MTISGLIEVCINGNFLAVCSFVGIGNNSTRDALLDLVCTTLGYDGQCVCRSVCVCASMCMCCMHTCVSIHNYDHCVLNASH